MPDSLPNKTAKLVPISEAAEILGVSIDTIRRWDKEGTLHSERPNGKDRYFSVDELEKVKLGKPLSISEVAERLHISQSTLRRIEKKGFIKPKRDTNGERVYTQNSLEEFLSSSYFLRKKEVEHEILKPLHDSDSTPIPIRLPVFQAVAPQPAQVIVQPPVENQVNQEDVKALIQKTETENTKVISLIASDMANNMKRINGLLLFRKALFFSLVFISTTTLIIVSILTLFFLIFPEQTGLFFGMRIASIPAKTQKLSMSKSQDVLGASTKSQSANANGDIFEGVLHPFSVLSLRIVKAINQDAYKRATFG